MKFTGIEKSKIRVIHNNLNDEWLKKFDERASRPYKQPYMLFVGNIKPHKNLRNLLLAFSKVAGDLPHHLVIVGNKSGFITSDNEVVEMAEKLSEKVSFTGHISLDDLKRHYKHAEGLLFPSLYEGFGFPPLEAMSCGCPTLVSNASSLPEICGDAALYCDPNDVDDIANKILQLAQNQVLRKNLVERGYNRITQFKDGCTKNTINTLLEVYDG
jgi:glycosyltransferase involved in cell wall biosynthesis